MNDVSIINHTWEFVCKWYDVDGIHRSIIQKEKQLGCLEPIPKDVQSREFAEWLANQYRLAMAKGVQLAVAEMRKGF